MPSRRCSTREDINDTKGLAASKTYTLTDITTNASTKPIALDKDDDWLFDVTPDVKQILVMTAGKDPRFVDVETGKNGRSFGGHKRLITTAALPKAGQTGTTDRPGPASDLRTQRFPGTRSGKETVSREKRYHGEDGRDKPGRSP
jgi:hypothetical protein